MPVQLPQRGEAGVRTIALMLWVYNELNPFSDLGLDTSLIIRHPYAEHERSTVVGPDKSVLETDSIQVLAVRQLFMAC